MAIYQAATGEWFNSDDTTEGPGVQISPPSWAGSSGTPSAPSTSYSSGPRPGEYGYVVPIPYSTGDAPGPSTYTTGGSITAPSVNTRWGIESDGYGGVRVAPDPYTPAVIRGPDGLTDKERAELKLKEEEAKEIARRNAVAEKLAQAQFDLDKAIADARIAYDKAYLEFQDRQLAQQAYDNSILAAFRNQQNMIAAAAQAQTAQYQGQQIALEQMQQRAALRRRRPFRSAVIRMAG